MLSLPRTTIAALSCLVLLAGCSGGGADDPGSSPSPTTSADVPPSTPPSRAKPGNVRLGEVDLKNFTFVGGCGFEVPAPRITLRDGKQATRTPAFDKISSQAKLTGSQQVRIGGTDYVVARFSCRVGDQKLLAAHLIGAVDGKPADLGIVATGTKITVDDDDDRLAFQTSYRKITDDEGESSGQSSYTIRMAGSTPLRVFGGEDASKITSGLQQLPPHGYDAGLVGIDGYLDDPDESTWLVGVLDASRRVLTADTIGGGYEGECLTLEVYTRDGEKIDGGLRAYPDDDAATGTAIDLKKAARAEAGSRAAIELPIKTEQSGLLVPPNGVAPALATVTTRTSDDQLKSPLVITRAPADAWIDVWRFGAASGSEYPLPIGAFATADGKLAMTGAWYNAPIDEGAAAFGMRPVIAPDAVGEKTCG